MPIEALRELTFHLNTTATALSALGVTLEAQSTERPIEPRLAPHVKAVLAELGAESALAGVTASEARALLAEIRTMAHTNSELLFAAERSLGWEPTDPAPMQAAGDASARFPLLLKNVIAPELEGLSERLEARGARFLDIGVGVGALSITMAQVWPQLQVVGVDPWARALATAAVRVRSAGLEERIALHRGAAEDLSEEAAFDLAWLPSLFIAERSLPEIGRRVLRALKPGGWLLFVALKPNAPLPTAIARLRTTVWGGSLLTPSEVESLLTSAGFSEVRTLPSSNPGTTTALIVARKPVMAVRHETWPHVA